MSARSKIDICNLALARLGAEFIRSFTEDNKRARMCELFLENTRTFLQTRYDWTFTRAYATLREIETVPNDIEVPAGNRVFVLPSDCLSPRDVLPEGSKSPWSVAGNKLLTQVQGDVKILYSKNVADTALFSEDFVSILSIGVAYQLAPGITQDKDLARSLYQQYMNEINSCHSSNANVGNEYIAHDGDPNNDAFVYPDNASNLPQDTVYTRD